GGAEDRPRGGRGRAGAGAFRGSLLDERPFAPHLDLERGETRCYGEPLAQASVNPGIPSVMQIHLAKSDITEMAVDAVVNPANSLGIMGGGVAAALSRKGGPSIQKEAMSLAPIAVGAAVVTN